MEHRTIRVWDLPTRLFHWLLVILVAAAVISIKIGGPAAMEWHGRFGHMVFGLIVFRLVWGFVGSTYARFWNFLPTPGGLLAYVSGRWKGLGHNPLGALSVFALLGLIGFQATSGLFANDDIVFRGPLFHAVSSDTSNWLSGLHRQTEPFIFGLIGLHVAAILFYRLVKKENLVKPMITGTREVAEPDARPASGGGWLAVVIALGITALMMWVSGGSWLEVPQPAAAPDLGW